MSEWKITTFADLSRLVDALEALVLVQAERLSARQVQRSEMSEPLQACLRKILKNAGYGDRLTPEETEDE